MVQSSGKEKGRVFKSNTQKHTHTERERETDRQTHAQREKNTMVIKPKSQNNMPVFAITEECR